MTWRFLVISLQCTKSSFVLPRCANLIKLLSSKMLMIFYYPKLTGNSSWRRIFHRANIGSNKNTLNVYIVHLFEYFSNDVPICTVVGIIENIYSSFWNVSISIYDIQLLVYEMIHVARNFSQNLNLNNVRFPFQRLFFIYCSTLPFHIILKWIYTVELKFKLSNMKFIPRECIVYEIWYEVYNISLIITSLA